MRIATWNLWGLNGDYVQRFQMILAEVRELSCDLICFQELGLVSQPQVISDFVEQLRLLGYNLYTCDFSGPLRKSELAVASRRMVSDVGEIVLETDASDPYPRGALMVRLAGKQAVTIVTTHLDYRKWNSSLRKRQLKKILGEGQSFSKSSPLILCGDFNCPPISDEVRALKGEIEPYFPGLVFFDCWDFADEGDGYTWLSSSPLTDSSFHGNSRIDYIMVEYEPDDCGLRILGCSRIGNSVSGMWPSDHLGVVAEITWNGRMW